MAEVQKTTLSGELTQRFIEFVMMHAQNAALFLGQIPNPKTGQGEVNLGSGQDVHRSTGDDSGKNTRQSDQRRGKSTAQRAFQFADGICGSCAGTALKCCTARDAGSRAVTRPAEQPPTAESEPSAPTSSTEPETESRKKFTKSYGP